MNSKVAYAIAAAVEKKSGLNVRLAGTNELWLWGVDEVVFALFKHTDTPPQLAAQKVLDTFKHLIPTYKIRKRGKDD